MSGAPVASATADAAGDGKGVAGNGAEGTSASGQFTPGLAGALQMLAQRNGIAVTAAALELGLTGSSGFLPLSALREAATRAGLAVDIRSLSPAEFSSEAMPFIAFLKDGNAFLIEAAHALSRRLKGRRGVDGVEQEIDQDDFASLVISAIPDAGQRKRVDANLPEASSAWFWPHVVRFWPDFIQIAIAGFVLNLLGLAVPIFTMNVYDRVIPNAATSTLWALFWGIVIVLALDLLLRSLRAWVVDEVGRRVDIAVSGKLFDHLLNLGMAGRPKSAGLLASQIKEFESVREVMTSGAVIAVTDACFIIVFLAAMHLIVGPLVIVSIVAVVFVMLLTLIVQVPISRAMEATQSAASLRHGTLVETVVGLETLKVVGAGGVMRERWDRSVAASSRALAKGRFWSSLTTNILTTVQQAVTVAITVWGVYLILDGQISMGALIAANLLSGRILAPLAGIAQTLSRAAQARTALRGLSRFVALPSERLTPEIATGLTPKAGAIVFQNVSFQYPGSSTKQLSQVKFSISPGERIGIVGRIGSGKTTIGRLLSGLYAPVEGAILIDGIDVRQYDVADLRRFVGVLPQDSELFSGTLRDNIVIGRPDASEDDLRYALEASGVMQFAASHPLGLAMPIIERGAGLSGGQRQSVALARLLIRRPRVMFLDEPTASMDQMSENALIRQLTRIGETGVTMLISTHRDSLLRLVDRLLVLDTGRLVMDGPRKEVLAALLARSKPGGTAPKPP